MAGRKSKPTALKKLAGNPGKRKLPKNEPKPTLGLPSAPSWLKGEGLKEWKLVTPDLKKMGVMALIDRTMLAAYCQQVGEYIEGIKIKRPVTASHIAQMRALGANFGLDPSSRVKIHGSPPGDGGGEEEEDFIAKGKPKLRAVK